MRPTDASGGRNLMSEVGARRRQVFGELGKIFNILPMSPGCSRVPFFYRQNADLLYDFLPETHPFRSVAEAPHVTLPSFASATGKVVFGATGWRSPVLFLA